MTIVIGTGGKGTRFVNTDYPNEEGLTLGTTKQTKKSSLTPQASYATGKICGS